LTKVVNQIISNDLSESSENFYHSKSKYDLFEFLIQKLDFIFSILTTEEEIVDDSSNEKIFTIIVKPESVSFFDSELFKNLKFLEFVQKKYSDFCFTDNSFLKCFFSTFSFDERLISSLSQLQTDLKQKDKIIDLIHSKEYSKWISLLKSSSCVQYNHSLINLDNKSTNTFEYVKAFVSKLSNCLEQLSVVHLLTSQQSDWIDCIIRCYIHSLILHILCAKRKNQFPIVSSYIHLVQHDLKKKQFDDLQNFEKKFSQIFKKFSHFIESVFKCKNLFICSKLMISVQRAVNELKTRSHLSNNIVKDDLFSLFEIKSIDISNEFLLKMNNQYDLLRNGFNLVLTSHLNSDNESTVHCLFKSYHDFLSVFISQNINKSEFQVDFAKILLSLENFFYDETQESFLSTIKSIKQFYVSSSNSNQISIINSMENLLFLFSKNQPKRISAAAKLFNHSSLLEKDFLESFIDQDTLKKTKIAEYEVILNLQKKQNHEVNNLIQSKFFTNNDLIELKDLADITMNTNVEMITRSQAMEQITDAFLNHFMNSNPSFQKILCSLFDSIFTFLIQEVSSSRFAGEFLAENDKIWIFNVLQMILTFLLNVRLYQLDNEQFSKSISRAKGKFNDYSV
jgi:hypothetical protein